MEASQVVTHTTSQPPGLTKHDLSIFLRNFSADVHTCHTFHAWHSGWGETSLPGGRRLLMELLVTSLVMLLVKASLLLLRQAMLGGWKVGLRRKGRRLHS